MLIHEVCKKCSLTKKAVEYYIEAGLISPFVQENGYRDFSAKDVALLRKISILRNLGLSVPEIKSVFSMQNLTLLKEISNKKALEIRVLQEKREILCALAVNHDWDWASEQLRQIEKKYSVLERLKNAFPGYYGKYLCLHFGRYLNEPVTTAEQQGAFDTIIDFLDSVDFNISDDLRKYLDEITVNFDETFVESVSDNMEELLQDTEKYLAKNREFLENYMALKQSEEYKQSPAYQLEKSLRHFVETSGYTDVFIPAMCQISRSYQEYYDALQRANEVFLQKYPQYPQD